LVDGRAFEVARRGAHVLLRSEFTPNLCAGAFAEWRIYGHRQNTRSWLFRHSIRGKKHDT
ncbi:MAG TPA: hypothetical protein PK925_16205, partial [Alicycliphilus sp.]|nr:hypothetical protein [Alicycliphilus sp.]